MLTYLINVTNDLLALSVVLGVALSFADRNCTDRGKLIYRGGMILGFAAAGIRAYITNTKRLANGWKVGTYGYGIGLLLFVLLMISFIVFSRSFFCGKRETRKERLGEIIISSLSGLLTASYLYGAMPNVYAYPFKFNSGGNGLLSTDYLFRLGGYLSGLIICLVTVIVAYKITDVVASKGYKKLLDASFFTLTCMYAVYNFARLMLVLTPRKIINSIALFKFAAFSNNHSVWYTYLGFAVLTVLSAVIWIGSATKKEAYSTKAQHRKQKAVWRTGKRSSAAMLVCFVLAILCATWFVDLNTVVIREAPVEDPVIVKDAMGEDSELWVALELVNDGHLHRFGYTTSDGYPVRFIVILKQENTNNYGVGLDACEICGEAGYYENKDGQIVCKKCGVVMNTTTIGMKGGCNPIIIDYDINESYIIVPVSEMINNQSRFKK